MAKHNELGSKGEDAACVFLESKGYRILDRNWRAEKKELDIVAEQDNELIVIEVKTRRNNDFGNPEDAVTNKKIRRIISATDVYIKKNCIDLPVRFDIITIIGQEHPFEIEHIIDAFYPPIW